MELEGRSTRQEILKKYCRWNQREGAPKQEMLKSTVDEIRGMVHQNKKS